MPITRSTFLTRVRQMSDTLYSTVEYPDELIKDFGSTVHVDEWRNILGAAPYYRTARRVVTLDANGRFQWSALSSGTGNALQAVFRVLEIADSSGRLVQYAQPDRLRVAVTDTVQSRDKLWTKNGSEVQTYGCTPGESLTVLVNWTPTPLGDLGSDADTIDWPDELRPVLYYEVAALLLSKGGRETQEATELLRMADMMRQKGLADIVRVSATPYILGADDDPWEWGG